MYKFNIGDKVVFHGKNGVIRCTVESYGVGRTESINGSAPIKINTYQIRDDAGYPYYAEEAQLTSDSYKTIGDELKYLRSLPTYLTEVAHINIYIGAILATDENEVWNKDDKIFILFVNGKILDSCLTAQQVCDKLKDLTAFVRVLNIAGDKDNG